jgi:hypothetical protein
MAACAANRDRPGLPEDTLRLAHRTAFIASSARISCNEAGMPAMDNNKKGAKAARELTATGALWRFLGTLILVLITYNPTDFSFVGWLQTSDGFGPEHFVAGIVLLIGWVILIAATKNSLNAFGMILGVLLLGGLVWLMIDFGLL